MRSWFAIGLIAAILGNAQPASSAAVAGNQIEYGTAWYPEQWPQSGWDSDLKVMRDAGFTFVRVAEFAWSTIEPEEGNLQWDWLDTAIARASAHGLKVVLGTPTAAPPAWMTTKYPEVLAMEASGRPARHGGRRQFSVGSALYREKAAGIAEAMAARYGNNPAVIGFQIDNEYGRATFDAETRERFQQWLRSRYGTLESFNSTYHAKQWSLEYSAWTQVPIPDERDSPSLYMDWMRFFSEQWRDYQQGQIDAIRKHLPKQKFITTNYTGRYDNFDFGLTAQPLDLVSWDWYFTGSKIDPAEGGLLHDMNRGFLGRNFWVMEAAPGNISWAERNYTMPKGLVRAMAWQAIGHGADGYAFWTWRPALGGVEQFHGALTDAGGRPQPVYAEVAQIGSELAKVRKVVAGTVPVASVALLHDFPSRWAMKRQPMTVDFDPFSLFTDFYRATRPLVDGIDVLRSPSDLKRYKLVVAPSLHVISAEDAQSLADYVRQGGHLVIGPRSGVKSPANSLWSPGAPGPLSDLIGAHVDQTHVLPEPISVSGEAGTATARIWAERIAVDRNDVAVLERYPASSDWLNRAPAAITRPFGKGRVTYLGAWLDPAGLAQAMEWTAKRAGVQPLVAGLPADVEVSRRTNTKHSVDIVINWASDVRTVRLAAPRRDLLGSSEAVSTLTLQPYGVAVLEER